MDSKQFDELVARLSGTASRRDAVKGAIGGALASVGVASVASAHGKGKGPKKSKKAKCKGKGKEKVKICHKGRQTITVSRCALKSHEKHGDTLGPCPTTTTTTAPTTTTAAPTTTTVAP